MIVLASCTPPIGGNHVDVETDAVGRAAGPVEQCGREMQAVREEGYESVDAKAGTPRP